MRSNRSDGGTPASPPIELAEAIERVRPRLGGLASPLHFFPTIGSTNDAALAIGAEGAVVVADEQTAGRGRRGHAWASPGGGLYVSVVLAPGRARTDARRATQLLTIMMGVALVEGIEVATGLRADLKWPNDLQVDRRKLAGILSESSGTGEIAAPAVAGFGINVAPVRSPELRDRATSLEAELGRAIDRHHVLAETLAAIAARYSDLLNARFDAILDGWRLRAPAAVGAHVAWTSASGPQAGVTAGIDHDGALLVRSGDRLERIVAGELTWL